MLQQPNNINSYKLQKAAILRRKTDIQSLYEQGTHFICFPIKATILLSKNNVEKPSQQPTSQVICSVGKKYHKQAVNRNLLRRRTKEAYRLTRFNLDILLTQRNLSMKLALSYVSGEVLNYNTIQNAVETILEKVADMAVPTAY